jgi:hypothetical protein
MSVHGTACFSPSPSRGGLGRGWVKGWPHMGWSHTHPIPRPASPLKGEEHGTLSPLKWVESQSPVGWAKQRVPNIACSAVNRRLRDA